MKNRIVSIAMLFSVCLLGCQAVSAPMPASFGGENHDDLVGIYVEIWEAAKAGDGSGPASEGRIRELVSARDESVRRYLDDVEWESFNDQYRAQWVDKIYRTTRPVDATQSARVGPSRRASSPSTISGPGGVVQ